MGYALRSARGNKLGLAIPIRTRVFLIGSSPKSQIRSRKPGIGRRHCAILSRNKQLFIQDMESGQPTKVNGLTIPPGSRLPLKVGDRVTMGPMEFVVELRKRKQAAIPVASPHGAPPLPVGRPAGIRPNVVSVTAALTAPGRTPVASPGAPRPLNNFASLVMLAALAIIGLGAGVGLSRAFLGGNKEEEPRVERKEKPSLPKDTQLARVEPKLENRSVEQKPVEVKKAEPKPQEKPVEEKKPEPPKEEPKKPDLPKEEPKKPEPPKEEPKKVEPPKEEPKKPEPPKEEPKKPEPPKEDPKKPVDPPQGGNRTVFATSVLPLLKERCVDCHSGMKKKGGLDVSTLEAMLKGGDSGPAIVAGNAEKSPLFQRVDDDSMPPAGKQLTAAQKKLLEDWIKGAKGGGF